MCTYKIKKTDKTEIEMHDPIWETADTAIISSFVWEGFPCKPETSVKVLKSPDGFHVKFVSNEHPVVTKYKNYGEPVCRDSCCEFFLNAAPSAGKNYMNIEINAIGTAYVGFGDDRTTSHRIDIDPSVLCIKTQITEEGWTLKYFIPTDFLEKYFGKTEDNMLCNFYKCAEEKEFEHYGTWSPIAWHKPDFHRPEFFGNIIIEN